MSRVVLIVEDSAQCAATLEMAVLGIANIAVSRFASAQDALGFLESTGGDRVAALITDLHLPSMDGFELIRQVRGRERYSRLPILVLSGDGDPRTPERARRLGADAYFPKPFSPSEVRKHLEMLLNVCA